MIFDCDIRQRDPLFDLGGLAGLRQVQIILCGGVLAKANNGKTANKQLDRNGFHRFADYPSQIFDTPLPHNSGIFGPACDGL